MKVRRFAKRLAYSAIGATALVSSGAQQALGDDRQAAAPASHHQQPDKHHRPPSGELVEVVQDATRRFRDVAIAQAEGYELHFGCVTGPDVGAMGLHYVNLELLGDNELDATKPEIVIYEPLPNGKLKLIGADYIAFAAAWDAKGEGPPQLMGQLFHLFESPNRFGLEAFYTLHVWAWKENPSGTFTNWHPDVSCEHFDGETH